MNRDQADVLSRTQEAIIIECLQRDIRKNVIRQYAYFRRLKKMTQKDVAEKAGISRSNISRFESGEYNPTLELMVKLANALDMDISIELIEKNKHGFMSNIKIT